MDLDDDQWWATLPAHRKAAIRRWLDKDSAERARKDAREHPDQLGFDLDAVGAE